MDTIKDILFIVGGLVGLATGIIALWAMIMDRRKRDREDQQRTEQPRPVARPVARPAKRYPEAIPVEEVPEVIPVEPVDEKEYDDRPRRRPRLSAKERAKAQDAVKAPAMAVMIAGGVGVLVNPFVILCMFLALEERDAEASDSIAIMMFFACTVASGIAIWAGYSMFHLRNHLLAMIGSFAIMPGACVCFFGGIGIGIWSVIVLLKPDVKEAFH